MVASGEEGAGASSTPAGAPAPPPGADAEATGPGPTRWETASAASAPDYPGSVDSQFDLLAIAVCTWSPHIQTVCEICLREAELGRRVGFAYLDMENVDEWPRGMTPLLGSRVYALRRNLRLSRVRAVERVLSARGVSVIASGDRCSPKRRLSCRRLGIDSTDSLRDFRTEGAALGLGALSSLIFHTQDLDPFKGNESLADGLLTAAYQAFDASRDLIARYRPKSVLVFNGRFACPKGVAEAARLEGVEVLYHEAGAGLGRYFMANRNPHSMEHARHALRSLWATAGPDREAVAAQFFSRDRGGMYVPVTEFLDRQIPGHSLPPSGRRRILYLVSGVAEYAAVEDSLDHGLFPSQRAAVEWLTGWARTRPDTELVIRVHPQMRGISARERAWWDALAGPNVIVLPADHPADTHALIESADRVVCFHSSLGPEVSYMGKVSILVGDAAYRGIDCVYEPQSVEELDWMLGNHDLPAKPRENCLPFAYSRIRRGREFVFYQPRSVEEGSFFGVDFPPGFEPRRIRRMPVSALYRVERMVQAIRSLSRSRSGILGDRR